MNNEKRNNINISIPRDWQNVFEKNGYKYSPVEDNFINSRLKLAISRLDVLEPLSLGFFDETSKTIDAVEFERIHKLADKIYRANKKEYEQLVKAIKHFRIRFLVAMVLVHTPLIGPLVGPIFDKKFPSVGKGLDLLFSYANTTDVLNIIYYMDNMNPHDVSKFEAIGNLVLKKGQKFDK